MSFPAWVSRIGRFKVTRHSWGRTGYGYKGYPARLVLHTTETVGFPGYGAGASQPHLTIRLVGQTGLSVRQHQPLNIGARALLGVSTNTANCVQVEQCMYSDKSLARSVGGLWVGDLSAQQLLTLGEFYAALCDLCGIPARGLGGDRRMSQSAWLGFSEICGHVNVPQNSHWDCGALNYVSALAQAGAEAGHEASKPSRGETRPKPGPAHASKWDRHGLTYSEVKSVQKALNDHFKAGLTVDGSYGPATIAAVKAAQRTLGVATDGIWGDATQRAYDAWKAKKPKPKGAKKPKAEPKLRVGSRGKAVKHLQAGLLRVFPSYAGPIKRSGGIDGVFGSGTAEVVREFQRRSGLTPDAVVGSRTWAALGKYHINP